MTASPTPRLGLPLLESGQAQKELFHNEAIVLLDITAQASVLVAGRNDPPVDVAPGQCWIVGAAPTGAWTGQAGRIAAWTEGGWRYVVPVEGMQVWVVADTAFAVHHAGQWYQGQTYGRLFVEGRQVVGPQAPNIPEPTGGATVDTEARQTIAAVLETLRRHGLIETI